MTDRGHGEAAVMTDEILDAFTHDHVKKQLDSALEYGTERLSACICERVRLRTRRELTVTPSLCLVDCV